MLQNLNMATTMEIDDDECDLPTSSSGKGEKKRFEVKKVSEKYINELYEYEIMLTIVSQHVNMTPNLIYALSLFIFLYTCVFIICHSRN